ncbi:MAG TPA: tyrosine-type recombinase/integrase, partial [Burkholderiales bacterium]|nr:tyrosine-type recombinase/integrase [Burkholderiales bacterium]
MLAGPLAECVPAYVARLARGGYASTTVARCLGAIAHFAHWMSMCRLTVGRLDESRIDQFLHDHLPHCGCPAKAMRHPREAHAALMPLLSILRGDGVIADVPVPAGPIVDELRRYDAYMRNSRGLADGTRRSRLRIVERLLVFKFGGGPLAFGEFAAEDIRRFVAEQLELLNTTSNAISINGALRAYLRWRASCGDTVRSLLAVISSPANWSLAPLPRALEPNEVERVLNSFSDTLRSPKRGYAIVRLALDLGLRSIEINRLQLQDVDWRGGTITLRRTKSRRQDVLPLPAITGKALEAYVRHERPSTTNPSLIVRRMAPHDQPMGVDAIRRVVRDAFQRAGIPHSRTHALRHTLACRLVQHGSSIKEVADVLRHRSLNTSLIYAKLNRDAL